ncbi:probable glycerol-3-phosphate acyltransferase 2 [Corylus avellana]|uniref:probable glycerol-3-phosphate acyltransferase 2 n=1 Tax=Corylus avellana TaxID=13451 RepID=UPI00286CE936|nr:probable glycerol-3-phosphate acyltransferase 2 [Corylus avellana]
MAGEIFNLKALFFLFKHLLRRTGNQLNLQGKLSNVHISHLNFQKYSYLANRWEELQNQPLLFHVEGALLKSSSLFPYFMLVAFEAGGPIRALILFLLYPFVKLFSLVDEELGLKILVFVCFVGIRKDSFRAGRAVLPKFFLEDVGYECFDLVMRCGRRVGVTNLPSVMVDDFLREYMGVEAVLGRELKVVYGFFVGLMEEKKPAKIVLNEIFGEEKGGANVVGIGCYKMPLEDQLFSHCKVICLVSEAEKKNWQVLPREKYPKPLIFHDGRLAFRPTPLAFLVMLMWAPLGFFLFMIRATVAILLPYKISVPIFALIGLRGTLSRPSSSNEEKSRGILYVCNHRTLLDPIYVSIALMKPVSAAIYSVSTITERFAPIKTIRLTRNKEEDSKKMEEQLSQGSLVVCPEGTTCREPYLLRFSPLFAETTDEIVPIAVDIQTSMFYGTTASGLKFLDPVFLLMNPTTHYSINILEKLSRGFTCGVGGKSKFEVANYLQAMIAEALGFECTNFTRKDKYMILAGNEGKI